MHPLVRSRMKLPSIVQALNIFDGGNGSCVFDAELTDLSFGAPPGSRPGSCSNENAKKK